MKSITNHHELIYESKRVLGSILGAFLYALGVNMFVVPADIYTGGLMGVSQILRTLLVDFINLPLGGFDVAGILFYAFNIPIMVLAWTRIDRNFVIKTLINVTFITLFLSVIPTINLLEDDILTSCIVGGLIAGAGTGITLRMGCTGGGLDVVSIMITQKKKNASVGKLNLTVNALIYLSCVLIFDVRIAIYSLVYSALYSIALDKIYAQGINVEAIVITKVPTEDLEQVIMTTMHRGITHLFGKGAYTGDDVNVLYIMLSKYEVHQLRRIIKKYDPRAFIAIEANADIYGNYRKKI